MFEFIWDLGTILNIVMLIMYLIIIISFPFVKIGPVGLKREICLKSEEIWHKVHVAAAIGTIPFAVISIFLLFLKDIWVKIIISLLLVILLFVVWDVIVKAVTKKDALEIKKKEQAELNEQLKKESGWR
ncbi:MAG: hypothetical protein IJS58_04715 [Bacilli bacterium]|nr:hypothetical protein [Bacilli bacterium]